MKKVIFAALVLCAFSVQARTREEVQSDVAKAVKESVKTYREHGVSGLSINSQECYENLGKKGFYCLYLDLAAMHIDDALSSGLGVPSNEYFSGENTGRRMRDIFSMSNMTPEQGQEYLDMMAPIINKSVDGALSKL